MLSTEEKKKLCEAAELGELATEQQNLHRQQISLQQHLELSLVKERRQVDILQLNVSDVWKQLEIQGDVNKLVMKRLEMLKADLTCEKTTGLRWQKLAAANQLTLKRLQTAHHNLRKKYGTSVEARKNYGTSVGRCYCK